MSYDSPNSTVRREHHQTSVAGNGAIAYFRQFQKMRLRAVHAAVKVAGTSNSPGHALTVKHGTTALGTFALGTSAQGVTSSIQSLDRTVEALGQLSVTNGTDATGTAEVIWEFETLPDAVQSS